MHIIYAFADKQAEWNTSEWRAHIPANGLNRNKEKADGEHSGRLIPIGDFANYNHDTVQKVVGEADIIVVQRNLITEDVWQACDYWRGLGKLVVADLDDDYPHLTPQNPAYGFWILDKMKFKERTGYTPIEALTEGFKHVDGLVSPNKLIISDWEAEIPGFRGFWLPNYAHWPWYEGMEQKPTPEGDEPVIVGWGGSVSHWDSWWFSGLRASVPILTEKYPRIQWKICGGDVRVKGFFDEIAPGRWIDQPGVQAELWPKQVHTFDIGLAPLCGPEFPQGERYDQRRSWIKAVEYLLTGVPWIASDGVVYEELNGRGGFTVENTPEAWADAVSLMMDELPARKAASKKLMRWARNNLTMEHCVEQYVKVFLDIWTVKNVARSIRLPNVLYSEDFFKTAKRIKDLQVVFEPDDMQMLEAWQARLHKLSVDWREGINVIWSGVDMPRCLQYPMLQVINEIVYDDVIVGEGATDD